MFNEPKTAVETRAHIVLRVGDVALCCPDASGRQGNIACTLLSVCSFIHPICIF